MAQFIILTQFKHYHTIFNPPKTRSSLSRCNLFLVLCRHWSCCLLNAHFMVMLPNPNQSAYPVPLATVAQNEPLRVLPGFSARATFSTEDIKLVRCVLSWKTLTKLCFILDSNILEFLVLLTLFWIEFLISGKWKGPRHTSYYSG